MYWLSQFRQWHWISGAICLIGILLFSITGITLNHAADIEAKPVVTERSATLPPDVLAATTQSGDDAPLPDATANWIADEVGVGVAGRAAEWSDEEIYIALARPGGDAWLTIDRVSGEVHYERTDRGWVSYLNDLHKGRNTGIVWSWFIDIFALACIVFSLSGLGLLYLYSGTRKTTWPLVGAGLAVPAILAIVFIH